MPARPKALRVMLLLCCIKEQPMCYRLGLYSVVLLGGGGNIRKWWLVKQSKVARSMTLQGIMRPDIFHSL